MNYLLNAFAVAALTVALAPAAEAGVVGALAPRALSSPAPLVQLAECEDECQDLMEAREQAQEARQDAARDAAEFRDEFAPRQEYEHSAPADRGAGRSAADKDSKPEPRAKTDNPVATAKADAPANSSKITTADTSEPKIIEKVIEKVVAGDAPAKSTSTKGCKQYFPAIGMTLSVPCEK